MLEVVYYELSRSEEHKRTKPVLVYTMDLLLVLGLAAELQQRFIFYFLGQSSTPTKYYVLHRRSNLLMQLVLLLAPS